MLLRAPRGDGHHVVAIPPFGAGDAFTTVLRFYLGRLGYHVHPWGRQEILALHRLSTVAVKRLDEVAGEAGGPVSLIGHSLGGIYAREVARAAPDARAPGDHGRQPVRRRPQVERRVADVRVGDRHPHQEHPARGAGPDQRAAARAVDGDLQPHRRRRRLALVHRRRGARRPRTSRCRAATSGCCTTRPCSYVIADRLAQPEGTHRPFEPAGWLRLFGPARARPAERRRADGPDEPDGRRLPGDGAAQPAAATSAR